MLVVLGNSGDEHVVVDETLLVGTVQRVVEWEASALLSIVLEVAEGLASLGEGLVVRDVHNRGAEGAVQLPSDLGLDLQDVTSLFLDNQGDLVGVGEGLRQVVEVEIVCSLGVTHRHFYVFCFYEVELGLVLLCFVV